MADFLTRRLRIWWRVYCKLSWFSAFLYRKSFIKNENKLRGEYTAILADYVYQKKVAPHIPKLTSKEKWEIILNND